MEHAIVFIHPFADIHLACTVVTARLDFERPQEKPDPE
jgi:hypothetical protein